MRTTESIIVGTNRNNQRIYIKRPCKEFDGITAYRDAFANEAQNGMQCNHPHLLRYMGMEEDEQGPFIALEYIPSMPLNRAVVEDSLNIRTEQEAKSIMMQLIDAVEYLHNKGIHHLNIRPENILITKRAHDVKLINPSSTYLHCQPSFFLLKEKYTAPELFADSEDINYQVCDVYSIGKVMEYLYSFCNLSTGTSRIIRKATHPNPAKRYGHVGLMKKELEQARYIDWGIQVLKLTAAAIFFGGIYYGFKDDEASEENIQFAQEAAMNQKEIPASNKAEDDHESYYVIPTPSDSVNFSPEKRRESDKQNEEYQQTTQRIFKKELRKRAEKIISNIYTPQNMELDEMNFQQQSLSHFNELDKIQRELAEQFNLDPILATKLSSDVISELTQENLNRLKGKEESNP